MSSGELPIVPDGELDFDPDLRFHYKDRPFTGVAYEDNPGEYRTEITYHDGYQEGPARDWYVNGVMRSETWYYGNMCHGPNREFRPDGTLALEEHYEYGIRLSSEEFDNQGNVVRHTAVKPNDSEFAKLEWYRREWAWPAPSAERT